MGPNEDEVFRRLGEEVRAGARPPSIDLSNEGLVTYLRRLLPIVRQTLENMESAEGWVADRDADAVDALEVLGARLSALDYQDLANNPTRDLVKLLGMVSTTRLLMLMADGHSSQIDVVTRGRQVSEGDAEAMLAFRLVLNRLWYLHRRRLLHRIYAPKRAHHLSRALRAITYA